MRKKLAWLLASVMILSAVALGGCGKKEATAESLVKQANENMEKVKSFAGDLDKMCIRDSPWGQRCTVNLCHP